jgi:uncharacterized membrane protein
VVAGLNQESLAFIIRENLLHGVINMLTLVDLFEELIKVFPVVVDTLEHVIESLNYLHVVFLEGLV